MILTLALKKYFNLNCKKHNNKKSSSKRQEEACNEKVLGSDATLEQVLSPVTSGQRTWNSRFTDGRNIGNICYCFSNKKCSPILFGL